jgi:uncharacterized protein (DUF305 family)
MNRTVLVLAAALLASACNQKPVEVPKADAAEAAPQTEAQQAYAAVNARMHEGMASIDADPDVAFMQGMLAHHRGAVEMSEVAQKYGKDAKVRELAGRIIKAQQGEIAEMEAWLKERGKPVAAAPAKADEHAHH